MQDLFGNPMGSAKDFPLTICQKRQAAILYHYASLDYLKGLIPLIDKVIDAFHGTSQTAQAQGRDALFTSKRWGVRSTSANADTHGTPFLSSLRETTLRQISDLVFEDYSQTEVQYAWGGLREIDTGWMSDAEYERYEKAWNAAYAYASNIDDTMDRQSRWDDSLLVRQWLKFHARFEPMPKFRVRTDVQAETGKKPPRTGVYISQDDPNGALQFAWTGGSYGALGECSTFNEIGLDALRTIGRNDLWLHNQKMLDYVENGPHTKVFRAHPNYADCIALEGAWAWASGESFTTRPCKWYFIEMISGEFDDETVSEAAPTGEPQRLRCEAGQPCPRTGLWSSPAAQGMHTFQQGKTMPDMKSDYGRTIWAWAGDAS